MNSQFSDVRVLIVDDHSIVRCSTSDTSDDYDNLIGTSELTAQGLRFIQS